MSEPYPAPKRIPEIIIYVLEVAKDKIHNAENVRTEQTTINPLGPFLSNHLPVIGRTIVAVIALHK